jgi:2-oxoglutarate/2-oxoacid ferredoxin oxidoreductase subunit alpha
MSVVNSFTWMIGGPQGSGINSVAENLARACMRGGLHVFANKVHATHRGHRHEVSPGGGIIYDSSLKLTPEMFGRDDIALYSLPYLDLLIDSLKEFGHEREISKYQVMVNTIALGASLGLVDYDFELAAAAIREGFTGRKASLGDLNVSAARHGFDYAKKNFATTPFPIKLHPQPVKDRRMMIRGVQAVGIAKM